MFTHVRCKHCGTCYNGRTGESNNTAIIIYVVVGLVVGGARRLDWRAHQPAPLGGES